GDAHEVSYARAVKELPLLARDRPLVAHREGREDARRRRRAEHGEKTVAHRLTRALDVIQRRMPMTQETRLGTGAHITRRADASLEQPSLVIEAMRIHQAMRAAKAHGERPALARVHRRCGNGGRVLLAGRAVPRK